ncbi:MAG: hypothetical protein HUJ70_02410 [Pseudobutyrivibrio sp.]|nr:hypothetical protein [Pseudobutyrivibrio sp.]
MNNKRLFLSLSEEDVNRLDFLREELGMNRSQYVRYMLSGRNLVMPQSLSQKELIQQLSDIDLHLKIIALKDGVDTKDVLFVNEALKDIRNALGRAFGPLDQK